jgi:sugar-specific transcriptional regulator TrmB
MNTSLLHRLEDIGLSPNEATVYLALLEIGQTPAGGIIKKTGLHRSIVYETLDKLIERKLAFSLKKQKITHYQPLDPERITQTVERQLALVHDLVPSLRALTEKTASEIAIYEGPEAYRRYWLEALERMPIGSTDHVAGSIGVQWYELMGADLDTYFRIALKRKISWKMIVFDLEDYEQGLTEKYPGFQFECRLIQRATLKEGNFNILGTESIVLNSVTDPLMIEVRNPSLVRIFQNIFDILWEQGIPISTPQKKIRKRNQKTAR